MGAEKLPKTEVNLRSTFWLTRIVFLRCLGVIYFVAFLVALNQNKPLIGENGLLPAKSYMDRVKHHFEADASSDKWQHLKHLPSVLWFTGCEDIHLEGVASAGLGLSVLLVSGFGDNGIILTALWILYHSLVNVGQTFYSFGWESQLLETGFLAIFLCPIFSLTPLNPRSPPPKSVLYLLRWLIFRIMLGAGLIKIRSSDNCWMDLTCLQYHYETQPNPNPISWFMHQQTPNMHAFGVAVNHFVELFAPFLLLIPIRPLRLMGGIIQIGFQATLIISGNLSFLNHLTILPAIATLDDQFLSNFLPKSITERVKKTALQSQNTSSFSMKFRKLLHLCLFGLISYLSISPVQNLLSQQQIMNTSFDSLRLVNTYGAFGTVGRERVEPIIFGTYNTTLYPEKDVVWKEYEFKCKPGSLDRTPCVITPYHYRLDWGIWFLGFPPHSLQRYPWVIHLVAKLLNHDTDTLSLMDKSNFKTFDSGPPNFVKAEMWTYKFTDFEEWRGSVKDGVGNTNWWKRSKRKDLVPAMSLESQQLRTFLNRNGWKTNTVKRKK